MVSEVVTSIPPRIAALEVDLPGALAAEVEAATMQVATLDAAFGDRLSTFGSFLVRTEAVSSSRIERHNASLDDLAKASIGLRSTDDARVTLAAARAVHALVADTVTHGAVRLEAILDAHRALLGADPVDGAHAGSLREVQNWIGGSDYSPRGAVHVPPPPELVSELMDDLLQFVARDDMPALAQAAIAHAQFESIHPFTDGNGRIGRALINAILRRRSVTRNLVVPVASALVADVNAYFGSVNAYREGFARQFVRHLARSAGRAADAAGVSAQALDALPDEWSERVHPRRGSVAAQIIDSLLEHPVLDAEQVVTRTGASAVAVYSALDRLVDAGVLHELTHSRRYRAWAATEVMAEIDELNRRLTEAVDREV